jgi:integrase/recombinase XerD
MANGCILMDSKLELTLALGALRSDLDGSAGSNRATGARAQISATNDVEALHSWLSRFTETPTTFANYRKEAERLLLWSTGECGKPLSSLTHDDLLAYQRFLADPQPAGRWVMANGCRVGRTHPAWRPFSGPLLPSSQRQAVTILNTLFSWLVTAGYLAGNPLALSRQRKRHAAPRVVRYLEDHVWASVKSSIELMPRTTARETEHHLRCRWLFSLLYLCGLRISEVANNRMGQFFCRRDRDGSDRWWLEVTGKGDKTRIIPATSELMSELSAYRLHYGLPGTPGSDESTPLLLPIGGRREPMTRSAIHEVVKAVFRRQAALWRAEDPPREADALHIEQASTHWLRHTAGSHMANQDMDLRHVRDTLGHESINTTSGYLHSGDDIRHRETEQHHKIKW